MHQARYATPPHRSHLNSRCSIVAHLHTTYAMAPKPVPVSLITSDLRGANSLVEAQVAAGIDRDLSINRLCTSIMAKVHKLGALHQSDVTGLICLSNVGPWTTAQKQQFAEHISGISSDTGPAIATQVKNQTCLFFVNMLTEEAWVAVRHKGNSLLARWLAIRLYNPTQPTLFRMVAILAYGDKNWDFTQDDVFGYMDKIQLFIKSGKPKKDGVKLCPISEYPASASQLPDSLKRVAYTDDCQPVDVLI